MNHTDLAALTLYFDARKSRLVEQIGHIVDMQSPTSEPELCNRVADQIILDLEKLGARIFSEPEHPAVVHGRFGSGPPRLALVFHHDTVWPKNSFPRFGTDGDKFYGPGIFDMKANIPLVMLSLQFWAEHDPPVLDGIVFISSPDEEIMGPVSRGAVHRIGRLCPRCLVFEPGLPGGGFKKRRKGVGRMKISFKGVPSHSGNHYTEGRSALKAAAGFLLDAEALSKPDRGFTVNVGLLSGGSAVNTRPAFATMEVDVRMHDAVEWDRFREFVDSRPKPDGVEPTIEAEPLLPPMNAEHEDWRVLEDICRELGQPFTVGAAGGGSDGSHLSAAGVKVMDGLGTVGAGEHAEHEHILVSGLRDSFLRNTLLIGRLKD